MDFLKGKIVEELSGRTIVVDVLTITSKTRAYNQREVIVDRDMDPTAISSTENNKVGKIMKCRVLRRNEKNQLEVDDVKIVPEE